MASKPAPLKTRPTVYDGKNVPVKLKRLLDQPAFCAKAAGAYEALNTIGMAILLDLPDYCRKNSVDAPGTVKAFSLMLAEFEVFKAQYELDRKNAQPEKKLP